MCMRLCSCTVQITEEKVAAVLNAAGISADMGRVKALVQALNGVNIEEAISQAQPAFAPEHPQQLQRQLQRKQHRQPNLSLRKRKQRRKRRRRRKKRRKRRRKRRAWKVSQRFSDESRRGAPQFAPLSPRNL